MPRVRTLSASPLCLPCSGSAGGWAGEVVARGTGAGLVRWLLGGQGAGLVGSSVYLCTNLYTLSFYQRLRT